MKFPVDLLADVSQTELERLAHNYMNILLYSNPDSPEHLALSNSTQVTIDVSSVGFVPLYGSGDKQKILALFSPSDPFTAVALYLLDRWWAVDDILKTADPARGGAVEVETVGERIVLYILNRVVYRAKEMSSEELPFLCHGEKDNAKILWNNGEAVGFYSVKPSGSFISYFSTRSYQLPVMDSIFVRKCQRGKGFGLQMLEDFVLSFKEDCLGLRYPITKFMYKVCQNYLCQYPGDTDLLWEVESIGGPNQRTNIARKIQAMDQSAVSKSLSFTEESLVITERTELVMDAITTQIKEAGSMECMVKIVEEVTLLSATKEAEVPLTARGRSSGSKRRNMGEKIGEDKSEKVIRIEDIEAETPSKDQVSAQQKTEGMSSVAPGEQGEHMLDQPATVLAQQDLQEDDVTLGTTTEEPQVEDNAPENLNSISCDSQVTVENVASEVEEECQKEDTAALAVSEEALEEAETLDKVGEGTQVGVTDEKSEERVTQQEASLSIHATSENGEAGKTGRADVKAVTTVESITPRRRSTRHSKQEEGVKQGTTAQKAGIILRGRTIRNTPPSTHKYTRLSQKVSAELEKEVDDVAEEEDVSTTQVVEESAVTEGEAQEEEQTSIEEDVVTVEELSKETKQLEDEQLKNEEKIEKQQEPGVEDTELPDTAGTALTKEYEDEIVTDQSEKVETSVIQNKTDVPENEIEEPPAEASAGEENADEQAADKQMEEHQQEEQEGTVDKKEEEITTEELTVVQEGTVPKAKEAAEDVIPSTKEEKQCEVSEICTDSEANIPVGDDAEGNLPLAEVDEAMSLEEEQAPVVETRALRRKTKTSTATPRRKSARGRKQVDEQEAENGEEEPAVATRTLRRGRVSTTDTPKGKSKRSRKQIQEEKQKGEEESKCVEETGVGEEDSAKEAAVEKTDEEIEEIVDEVKEAASENEEGLELEIDDVEEGEAVAEQKQDAEEDMAEQKQDAEEDKPGLVSEPLTEGDEGKAPEEDKIEVENEELVTVEVEKGESEEGTMMLTEEEENTAVVTASADDLVQEESDAPLPSPATDSAVLPPVEDEATPSAEEQRSEETATQLSDLRRVTVVLVDLQKNHHDVHDETAATEEGLPVQKTAAEAQEEQREETMKEEETVAQKNVPESSVGIEKTELGKVTVKEERCEDKVEAEEGRDEETAEAVEATPRTRGRLRKVRKAAASKNKEMVPIVEIRVLRAGRKSYYARQRSTTKRTRKQLQEEEEEEGGEDSTAVEARETEEEEEEQQMTDRKKGEKLEERDATEQAEHIEAEMASEKEDIVAEQAVNQHDAQEEGQIDCTETVADADTEASVGQHDDEEKTLVVAEEALAKQDTVEKQSTSTSEVAESAQETMLTATVEQAEDASEEEAPVVERVLRSGEKSVRGTTGRKTTKKHEVEQEEEAPGENITEEDEPAVEIRVLRKGRKPADATPRRKSKRARTQCQTEEEREEETSPPEETQVEETKAVLEETDPKEESRDETIEEKDGDEDAPPDEGNTEPELWIVAEALSGESKRTRTQCQQEEVGEEEATPAEEIEGEEEEAGQESSEEKDKDVEEEEARNAAGEEPTVGDAEQTKDASTEEAAVLEEEVNSVEAVDGISTDTVLTPSVLTPSSAEEETAVVEQPTAVAEVGSDAATAEGEALVEDAAAMAEDEAPAVTTRVFRCKQKASPATPSPRSRRQQDDSPRKSVRKRPTVNYRENNEGERDETEGNTDEEEKVTVASDEDQGNEKAEPSSDTDEEVEAAGSSQEDEEYEQDTSEEEEEPIVIGKRVLRGRSVPSIIITPQSKSRCRSAKVSKEERSPRSAQKRKGTEVTRKSKRLSRV